eukprot:m.342879 g.342879  ORF g.342879 m.342879 type:complete len:258 (-) comp21949_c0_seq1:67-840(-)
MGRLKVKASKESYNIDKGLALETNFAPNFSKKGLAESCLTLSPATKPLDISNTISSNSSQNGKRYRKTPAKKKGPLPTPRFDMFDFQEDIDLDEEIDLDAMYEEDHKENLPFQSPEPTIQQPTSPRTRFVRSPLRSPMMRSRVKSPMHILSPKKSKTNAGKRISKTIMNRISGMWNGNKKQRNAPKGIKRIVETTPAAFPTLDAGPHILDRIPTFESVKKFASSRRHERNQAIAELQVNTVRLASQVSLDIEEEFDL